ncbi:MAG: response regulator [Candidatus Portnoybacteria bacterium]|nr:response regulator [Candidatus Portnoybacteria bacterium]
MENKKMIFVVDDDDICRESLGMILENQGYKVRDFPDGKKAWDAINEKRGLPDLLITDGIMPEMGGEKLTALVKSSYKFPVIMVSGACEKMRGCPVDALMGKPFDCDHLLEEVKRLI